MTEADRDLARPYRMHNQIQHYAWGTEGEEAYIPELLQVTPEPDTPYAELWMGSHPKAPSQIEDASGEWVSLDQWIAANPIAALGESVADTYQGLPFLLKVLTAGQSLSIQAHPNKSQAVSLHRRDPAHYPDGNHKPEIAVALDGLTALMGFKPYGSFITTLNRYPELGGFLGRDLVERATQARSGSSLIHATMIREVFAQLIQRAEEKPEALESAVDALVSRLQAGFEQPDEAERLFMELQARYGSGDVGLFALLLFNIVHLSPGEALFTEAGVPHAYLKGNIIECMANSDNVVRVGLTPKFRDAKTLLKIVDTTPGLPEIRDGEPHELEGGIQIATYRVPSPEFTVSRWVMPAGTDICAAKGGLPAVLLVIKGRLDILWDGGRDSYRQGETAFLPAALTTYVVKATSGSEVIVAGVGDPGAQATVARSA